VYNYHFDIIGERGGNRTRDLLIGDQMLGTPARSLAESPRAVATRRPTVPGQRPDILARRREIVEHPFGTIKQWMNQGAFLMRGLDKVRAEFSLTALVYNLRRALNILGVARLMAAVAG
jgi:Transposase DDE domain